jgi:hypothetical protein
LFAVVVGGLLLAATNFTHAAEFVIHISVDGLNAELLREAIEAGRAPTFQRLIGEGASTLNARTDDTYTVTLPNHTSMLTGRPVEQPEGMADTVHHGWILNDEPPRGATLHNTGNTRPGYIASTFDVAHDAGLKTALFATKDKFVIYDHSYNETAGAQGPHGRDKIDDFHFSDDGPPTYSQEMNHRFVQEMVRQHFPYSFVHYRDTDSAGHAFGWGSPEYRRAIATVDRYLADVVALVETDPKLKGKTAILLSTDHGGLGTDHGECERSENYTIPFIVWGAGVAPGDLYAMNRDTRADPGAGRLDYNAPLQPIRNGDTGNLALKLLGLGPIPGSLINAKQDLRVR